MLSCESSMAANIDVVQQTMHLYLGMLGLASKWVRSDPKWDKSVAFSDQISVHLARGAKCTEI